MAILWESNGVIMEKPTIFFGLNGSIFGGLISNSIHKPLGRLIGRYHLSRHFGAPIINQPGIIHQHSSTLFYKPERTSVSENDIIEAMAHVNGFPVEKVGRNH